MYLSFRSGKPGITWRFGFLGCCGLALVGLLASSARAAPILIDDFAAPSPGVGYAIALLDLNPMHVKTPDAAILGGERDLLVTVAGTPGPVSATGVIGGGTYLFGTVGAGASVTLQYDGADADFVGPPAALVNAGSLGGIDLVDTTNTDLQFDFLSVDGGADVTLDIEIAATSSGGSATFLGAIPEDAGPSSYVVPFTAFNTVAAFSFEDLTSLEVVFNRGAVHDVDFELDTISAVPEPGTIALLMLGGLGVMARLRQ